ncbi:uncharacterized protein LOC142520425 [Primulina tabacum]|uniref:uncharacterized protein LOC142520425 n=1 Tax=Primulina tabacum TaxID=48773 RepID=UPI003F598F97
MSGGSYYLCDDDYGNVEGFLTPYKRTRYHLVDWGSGLIIPQDYKESFNVKHCHVRNVIERTFELLKRRWTVLRSPSFYPLKVQINIIFTCILLHNFIRMEMPDDPLQEPDDAIVGQTDPVAYGFIENLQSSTTGDAWRDNLAMSMDNKR